MLEMQEKFFITPEGYAKLENELSFLKTKERPSVIKAIEEARAHGDLSENAEYHAAKEKQGFIEAKIADLESRFARAELIDISKLSGSQVIFGCTVTLQDEEVGKKSVYKIVSDYEASLSNGSISVNSPVAKAMLGRSKGDEIEVNTPGGTKYYHILNIEYK
jgi:transcription elongation factor GreA